MIITRKYILVLVAVVLLAPTQAASQSDLPATPASELCTVDPRSSDDLNRLITEPFDPPATIDATTEEVPDDVEAAIVAAVTESVACTNANQPLRSLTLFTDRYLAERFSIDNGDELGHLLAASTRETDVAASEDQLSLLSVADLSMLTDGRISAEVTTSNAGQIYSDALIFASIDGRWLIDQVITGDAFQLQATPATGSEDS